MVNYSIVVIIFNILTIIINFIDISPIISFSIVGDSQEQLDENINIIEQITKNEKGIDDLDHDEFSRWMYEKNGYWQIAHVGWGSLGPGSCGQDAEGCIPIHEYPRLLNEMANWQKMNADKLNAAKECAEKSIKLCKKLSLNYILAERAEYTLILIHIAFGNIKDAYNLLIQANILYQYYKSIRSFFHNHQLLIPFYNMYGEPISISGRTLSSEKEQKERRISKYKHLPFDKKRHLFGLNLSYKHIVKENYVIIVEGQFDWFAGYLNGAKNIIATCGSKLTFEHIVLLKRFTDNFYILFDSDEGGETGWEKAIKQGKKYKFNVDRLVLPDKKYKDLDDYVKEKGYLNLSEFKGN